MCDQCAPDQTCVEDWLGNNAGDSMRETAFGGRGSPMQVYRDVELKKDGEPVLDVFKAAMCFMKYAGMAGPESEGYKEYMSHMGEQILELIDNHRRSAICFSPNTVIVRNKEICINIICPTCGKVLRSVEK